MVFFEKFGYVITWLNMINVRRMEFIMENRKILFEKIEAKEREWDEQVKYLQSKAAGFDPETRIKVEKQINILNIKLKEVEQQTGKLKKISDQLHSELGDKLVHSWIELFTEIDNAMLKLKK